ncbi:bifunctional 2-polyprenyl-6-hydroxyphenol methylase/3-demethylubiquinol 3-O-methyltransferase UbiG [Jannaschia sp. W003]|uniref:class I SAM-dependent methyltransferase n=1 Tax=Jannaschia sp. W003 TaxID=2867012 RepID=UPI0021A3782F|nr:methyltransferase domain-containing protein [Jannaschia sp. W003]UWQ23099.1 methyltransferase domain-containing protein [Jannaschia sp. W003]
MERLPLRSEYTAVEMAIHCARYALARPFCEGRCVLDIACGEGYGTELMARWGATSVTGADIDPDTVETCTSLFPERRFVRCAAEDAAGVLEPGSFDLIVSLETMEHVEDLDRYFAALEALRAPGGGVVITCPNDGWYNRRRTVTNEFHLRELDFAQFREAVAGAFPDARIAFQTGSVASGFLNAAPGVEGEGDGTSYHAMLDALAPLEGVAVPPQGGDMPPSPETASYFVAFVDLPAPGATFAGFQLPMEALRMVRHFARHDADLQAAKTQISRLKTAREADRERIARSKDSVERYREQIRKLQEARAADRTRLLDARAALERSKEALARSQEQVRTLRGARPPAAE